MNSKFGRLPIVVEALMVLAVLPFILTPSTTVWARPAGALVAAAPTGVTGCGTLSGNSLIYKLTKDITTSSTGNCIVLSGHNSVLDLHGFNVTGPGLSSSGSGVLVTGNNDLVEGFNSTVSGFLVGVTDSSSNSNGDDINMDGNGTGMVLNGSTSRWTNLNVGDSSSDGIRLNGCQDECSLIDAYSHDNGGNGILVKSSPGATITLFTSNSNAGDGVHIGCSSGTGGCTASAGVAVLDGFAGPAFGFGQANNGNGVVLDATESGSKEQVSTVTATGNKIDLFDVSNNCGTGNLWVDNTADTSKAGSTSNPTCIPVTP